MAMLKKKRGETFGRYMKRLREAKGYESQRHLSIASGVSNSTISRLENDEYKPSVKVLRQLAPYLGVTLETLMKAIGYIPDVDNNTELQEVVENYAPGRRDNSIPFTEEERAYLRELIRLVKESNLLKNIDRKG